MKRRRRIHASGFKAKLALAAVRGDKTLPKLAEQFDVHPNRIQDWGEVARYGVLFDLCSARIKRLWK